MLKIELCPGNDIGKIRIISTLANEIWREYYVPILGKTHVEYMLDKFQSQEYIKTGINDGMQYYLLAFESEYIGYFAISADLTDLFLSKFYIKAKYRGKGHGKQIMTFIEDVAKKEKLQKIYLRVNKKNTKSMSLYTKFGFNISETLVTDIGGGYFMDDYKMEKLMV